MCAGVGSTCGLLCTAFFDGRAVVCLDVIVVELWMAPLSGAKYFCAPPEFWELICVRMCREFVFSVRLASRYVLVCSYVVYAFRDSYLRQRMYSCACAVSVFSVWFTLRVSVCVCGCVRVCVCEACFWRGGCQW